MNVCCLIHLDSPPRGNQQHCIVGTSNLRQCLAGHDSELTRAAFAQGIGMALANVWIDDTGEIEVTLRQRGNYRRLCSICRNHGKSSAATKNYGN